MDRTALHNFIQKMSEWNWLRPRNSKLILRDVRTLGCVKLAGNENSKCGILFVPLILFHAAHLSYSGVPITTLRLNLSFRLLSAIKRPKSWRPEKSELQGSRSVIWSDLSSGFHETCFSQRGSQKRHQWVCDFRIGRGVLSEMIRRRRTLKMKTLDFHTGI